MERREHRRRRFWLPIEVDGIEGGVAVSHDASDGGLSLVCPRPVPVGAPLEITLRVPPGGPVAMRVWATVVRSSRNEEDPDGLWPYKVGVQFDDPIVDFEAYLRHVHGPATSDDEVPED